MESNGERDRSLEKMIKRRLEQANTAPMPALDGLSPNELHKILYSTFEQSCPLQYRPAIPDEVIEQIPFYKLFREYLDRISEAGELKLTARGNLPRKFCKEMYGLGIIKEEYIESGLIKLNREADSMVLSNLKIIGNLSGITKKRNNKLSLTKKGEKLYQPDRQFDLFRSLFETNIFKFNLGYHDGYPQESGVQQVLPFTLHLLLKYGKKQREIEFYVDKNLKAFPRLLMHFGNDWSAPESQFRNCYKVRTFERCLKYYGLVDMETEQIPKQWDDKVKVVATDIYKKVFEIRE